MNPWVEIALDAEFATHPELYQDSNGPWEGAGILRQVDCWLYLLAAGAALCGGWYVIARAAIALCHLV